MRSLALVLGLAGCSILGPDMDAVDHRPLEPLPESYPRWYAATEACLGRSGDFGVVRWFVAESLAVNGREVAGVVRLPHAITMRRGFVDDEVAVRHEMVHEILGRGDELHSPTGGVPCA